jgi:FtsP/CotA-like multicopper oxidase with cupredoxin domain
VTVDFTNETDLETTVHWHGLRVDNRFDGVPEGAHHGMQPPIAPGGRFSYRLRFPDPGVYWYHPHIREDYTQEMGLYGNIVVVPSDPDYWSPVNRELTLTLDDILIEDGDVATFSRTESNRTAMGRFGNVMLTNGEADFSLEASWGEVIRLYLTNVANARTFNFRIPGVRMKLVGRDQGRVEHEEFIDEVLISPSERIVMDVLFDRAGEFAIEHGTPDRTYSLGTVRVTLRRLPFAFGWMSKRLVPDEVMDGWLRPALTQREVRRDLLKYLHAVDKRDMLQAAERLRSFERPALVVWAAEDRVMPPEHGRRLAELLPRGRLIEIDDSYTLIPEDRPLELSRVIRDFVRDTL